MAINRDKLHRTHFDDVVSACEERDSPVAPGEVLHEEFLEPLGLSAAALARALHVPSNRVTALINGQRSVSADTALRHTNS
jgi:addiction module HigA family antidote